MVFIDYHVSTARQSTKQDSQTEIESLHKKFKKSHERLYRVKETPVYPL